MRKSSWTLLLAFSVLLAACFGRPRFDAVVGGEVNHDLKEGIPAVVIYSALWCHPCREEIDTMNRAVAEFGDKIQFVGYLVEGEEKGSPVQESDIEKFTSFGGDKPAYPVRLDEGWSKFDRERPPQGRALPTMALYDAKGKRFQIIQQSLDYHDLQPTFAAMAANAAPPPIVKPTPTPPPDLQQLTDTVENWLARPEVKARAEFATNLEAAWQRGLKKLSFTEDQMPLEEGQITFSWDGQTLNVPQTVKWEEDTPASVCKLQVTLNTDASYASATGSCVPK